MQYALLVYLCHKRDFSHDSYIIWSIVGIQSGSRDSFHSNFERSFYVNFVDEFMNQEC